MPSWLSGALLVGAGGFAGAIARHALVSGVRHTTGWQFIWGVLLANVIGCLIAGFVLGWFDAKGGPPLRMKLLLVYGFLGAMTTFSAFGVETIELVRQERTFSAIANVALNVVCGLGAVAIGFGVARSIAPPALGAG